MERQSDGGVELSSVLRKWHGFVIALYRITPQFISKWAVFWLKPKYVIAVVALVADNAGRLLVLHHTYGKRYFWRCPGGIKERHEHPFTTAERELREEANMVVKAKTIIGTVETWSTFDIAVYCELVEELPFQINPEVDGLMWINPVDPEVIIPPEQEQLIKTLQEMMK